MKTIPNTIVPIRKSETEPESRFSDLAKFALNQTPQGGFDLATIRARLKVVDKCDSAQETIELEDAEFETLRVAVQAARWPWGHASLVQFAATLGL